MAGEASTTHATEQHSMKQERTVPELEDFWPSWIHLRNMTSLSIVCKFVQLSNIKTSWNEGFKMNSESFQFWKFSCSGGQSKDTINETFHKRHLLSSKVGIQREKYINGHIC